MTRRSHPLGPPARWSLGLPPEKAAHPPQQPTGTVLILDSDPDARRATAAVLEGVHLNVQTFGEPRAFFDAALSTPVGCAIIDERLPGFTALQLFEQLYQRSTCLQVIFTSPIPDVLSAVTALKRGVHDYLVKPISPSALMHSVYEAVSRSADLHERRTARQAFAERLAQLTPRESQVLAFVVQGLPSKLIGVQLGLRAKTVEAHRTSIMEKLGVTNVAELVSKVVTHQR